MNNLVTLVRLLRSELNTKEIISVSILEELSIELNNYAEKYIKNIYNKSDSYLIDIVYVKESSLDTETKINNYYRASLSLAIKEFRELIKQINNDNITLLQKHIISYLFDIKPFIEFFEKKQNEDFVLFYGARNYYTTSQEIRLASQSLFWQLPQNSIFDQKIAFNLAIFTLRQSLELKFKRICGIDEIHSNNYLGHDFFINFIKKNNHHFDFPENFSLCGIFKIYKWTNRIVHSGNRPRIWEIQFALEFTQSLFSGGTHKKDNQVILSVFGAVKIKEFNKLKHQLNQEICQELKTDISKIKWLDNPEAVIQLF
ncbi:MAG: hypothetical protein HEQ29_13795 [Dolichospermum sp. LBC05a]|nr:hypothetical protein [Dolichospermum sp. OL01]MCO5797796.1 hypothetical protein [Dolichospermum sp. OL03]MCS6282241.1 hypothetical protein [Dolichospermum sp.]QSV59293.1 MAG: hypothetical protein HEQ29_13795 [Dolichospermum sp. LBC05a]